LYLLPNKNLKNNGISRNKNRKPEHLYLYQITHLDCKKKSQIFPAEIGRRLPTSQPVNAYVSCRLYITGAVRGKFAGSGSCRQ